MSNYSVWPHGLQYSGTSKTLNCVEHIHTHRMEDRLKRAAEEVHAVLGAGFTETIYHSAYQSELSERGIRHVSEGSVPVYYKGAPVGRRRPDMFVKTETGETILLELKAGSNSGREQLFEYLDLVEANDNYPRLMGGAVVRFNETVEFEYKVVRTDIGSQEEIHDFEK